MNLQFSPNSQNPPFSITFSPPLYSTISISSFKFLHNPSFRYPFASFLHWSTTPSFQFTRCSFQEHKVLEAEGAALLVSRCITRSLPPALSLEQGLDRIQDAVEELKSKPPCSSSGMFRFQVAVPPSTKALNWFCCQHYSTRVFPLFFVSKEEKPTYKSLALGRTHGVFGAGAAVFFQNYSYAHKQYGERKRYPTTESTFPMAYGFLDVNIDLTSSSAKHEAGSSYFFIPQIELDELNDIPILSATIAWNNSSSFFLLDAIQDYEFCLYQVP